MRSSTCYRRIARRTFAVAGFGARFTKPARQAAKRQTPAQLCRDRLGLGPGRQDTAKNPRYLRAGSAISCGRRRSVCAPVPADDTWTAVLLRENGTDTPKPSRNSTDIDAGGRGGRAIGGRLRQLPDGISTTAVVRSTTAVVRPKIGRIGCEGS